MQKIYKGCLTLLEYCEKSEAGTLERPREEGYESGGFYSRTAIDEDGIKHRIWVHRNKSKTPNQDPPTISYLPEPLPPYRKYSMSVMNRVMVLWRLGKKSVEEAVDAISLEYDQKRAEVSHDLADLGYASLQSIKKLYEEAHRRYRIWKGLTSSYRLDPFVALCARSDSFPGRRYYDEHGGRFLFGTASQFRPRNKNTVLTG